MLSVIGGACDVPINGGALPDQDHSAEAASSDAIIAADVVLLTAESRK
jgi:hypothetical protein